MFQSRNRESSNFNAMHTRNGGSFKQEFQSRNRESSNFNEFMQSLDLPLYYVMFQSRNRESSNFN